MIIKIIAWHCLKYDGLIVVADYKQIALTSVR